MSERAAQTGGARTMGNFEPLVREHVDELEELPKVELHTTDERCSDCRWPSVCADDRTCWDTERRLLRDVDVYRKREKLERAVAANGNGAGHVGEETDADVVLHPEAEHQADDVIDALGGGVADGITIELEREPPEANANLIRALGADYVVKKPARKTRWTREKAIAAIQAYAARHGHPPGQNDTRGNRELPTPPTANRLFGSWPDLIVAAGFDRPTRGTRYGKRARPLEEAAAPDGHDTAASSSGSSSGAELEAVAEEAAADESPATGESAGTQPDDAGSTPASRSSVRVALHGVLDALHVLVDAFLPDEAAE